MEDMILIQPYSTERRRIIS